METHPTNSQLKRWLLSFWSELQLHEVNLPNDKIQRHSKTYFSGLWDTYMIIEHLRFFLINWNYTIRKLPRVYWYIISVRHIQHIFEDGFTTTQLHFPRTNRDNGSCASRNEKVGFMNCTLKMQQLEERRQNDKLPYLKGVVHMHVQNWICYLKRDHFERKLHLNQPSIFRGHVLIFFGGGGLHVKEIQGPMTLE